MAREELDRVTIKINGKLGQLSPLSSEPCLFKIPGPLRMVNEKAYEPAIIAIGPYHRGKEYLKEMEECKIRYLSSLLQQNPIVRVSRIVQRMRKLEDKARKCYAETVQLNEDEFVEMLVLDGCFIFELFRESYHGDRISANRVFMDLLLLENQLPFFIIWELIGIVMPNRDKNSNIKAILDIFKNFVPGRGYVPEQEYTSEMIMGINHLPGLIYDNWLPPLARMEAYKNVTGDVVRSFVRCATELQDAGIEFKKVERSNMFDIKFKNGILEIPVIEITDRTELDFRNFIAYEQISCRSPKFVTDYMVFMDSLINSSEDVELLCRHGIIDNYLGDDETIATLFNQLGKNIIYDQKDFYSDIVKDVKKHCSRQWNVWMAMLRHDYFNTPWALISFLAAVMLLVLTWTQTVYSILSFYD